MSGELQYSHSALGRRIARLVPTKWIVGAPFLILLMVFCGWLLTEPMDPGVTDWLWGWMLVTVASFGVQVGALARVELWENGMVVYNLFTVWFVTNSMVTEVVPADDRLALVLRDGRRIDVMGFQEGLVMGLLGSPGNRKLLKILRLHVTHSLEHPPVARRHFRLLPIRVWVPATLIWTAAYWLWFDLAYH